MSNLCISPVFKEIKSFLGSQEVSFIYFGRHCGKNILLIQHDVTIMLVFSSNDQLNPDFIKFVSWEGNAKKGTQIVGNEDVLLLLDDTGRLWRLVNAFELSNEQDQRLHLLDEKCFYEWVPFRRFNFVKVLSVSAWGCGFACLGLCGNSEKKLVLLSSAESHFAKDHTFQELGSSRSLQFLLTNIRKHSHNSTDQNDSKLTEDALLIADRFTGKIYLCSHDGEHSLINYSNIHLVSALHFEQENCLLFGFQNGKLVFHFLSSPTVYCVRYLPKKLSLIEKCCCSSSCLLWSDGLCLHHTELVFQSHEPSVKLFHLKLACNIDLPSRLVKLAEHVLVVTVNNIFYRVRAGADSGERIRRSADELLSEICKGSLVVHELNTKTDVASHFLSCKEVLDGSDVRDRVEMSLDRSWLLIKLCVNVVLRRDFWKVRLVARRPEMKCVKMADLETDVSEGMVMRIENPFKSGGRVKVGLVGDFDGEGLFVDLGEVGESEEEEEQGGNELSKHLEQILIRRNPFCRKESAFNCG